MPSQSSGSADMDSKYKGILGFGTPNIRPSKRLKHMDQDQIRSHISLQQLWGNTGAGGKSTQDEERDSNNFKKSNASEFFKKTRAAEIELKSKFNQEKEKEAPKNVVKPSNPPNSKEAVKRRLLNFEW